MAQNSKIEWTDHTVNLWWGCSKVHTGCMNCYAEYTSETRLKKAIWGEHSNRQRIKSAFPDLDKYQAQAIKNDKLLKVFIGSMMDIFELGKPVQNPEGNTMHDTHFIRQRLFHAIDEGKYPNLIFLFLTKRPQNIEKMIPPRWVTNYPPANVWFGCSISNQETADKYIPILNLTRGNKFLSVEPQVGEIVIDPIQLRMINWVIQGGESGNRKRPFNIKWAESLKFQCHLRHVPYFFKQIDKVSPIPDHVLVREFPVFEKQKIKQEPETFTEWFEELEFKLRSMGYRGPIDRESFEIHWVFGMSVNDQAREFMDEMTEGLIDLDQPI